MLSPNLVWLSSQTVLRVATCSCFLCCVSVFEISAKVVFHYYFERCCWWTSLNRIHLNNLHLKTKSERRRSGVSISDRRPQMPAQQGWTRAKARPAASLSHLPLLRVCRSRSWGQQLWPATKPGHATVISWSCQPLGSMPTESNMPFWCSNGHRNPIWSGLCLISSPSYHIGLWP